MDRASDTVQLSSRDGAFDDAKPTLTVPLLFATVPLAIGGGIAEALYHMNADAYDLRIASVRAYDLHWPLFGAVLFGVLTRFLNFFAGPLKGPAMAGRAKGNIRANMYLYKVSEQDDSSPPMPPVILEDRGAAGMYNRANRSLHHFLESSPPFLLNFAPAGFLFPHAAFVLMCVFAVGRVAHQVGYTTKGYGGHGAGFGLALLASVILEGLVFVAALRAATT